MSKIKFESPEERRLNIYLAINLRLKNPKKKKEHLQYMKGVMAKRREQGKTQKASRDYIERNKLAFKMYMTLIYLEPGLIKRRKKRTAND